MTPTDPTPVRSRGTVHRGSVEFVAEEGFDPEFGARPLRRTIQRRVDNELSRMVLEGSLNPGDKVIVDLGEDKLTFGVLDETSPTGTAS
jgi:ATP-dependent Clp protease ATP-binding subunit ClpC